MISFAGFTKSSNESSLDSILSSAQFSLTVDGQNIICGMSGAVYNADGEMTGTWYSSCVHAQPTIIINYCDGTTRTVTVQRVH